MIAALSIENVASLAAAAAAMVAAVGGVWAASVGVREYKLKSSAQRVEIDVQLSKLLAELIPIANGRSGHVISETAAEVIAQSNKDSGPEDLSKALSSAVLTLPVGEVTQIAAVASIGYLGTQHKALRDPSYHALRSLDFASDRPHLMRARNEALEAVEAMRVTPG